MSKGRSWLLGLLVICVLIQESSSSSCRCGIKYVKKGCYYDPGSELDKPDKPERPLKQLLVNHRDRLNVTHWSTGWNAYLENLACTCAKLASKRGYQYFGLQYFGECWSGVHSSNLFAKKDSKQCWGTRPDYEKCDDGSTTECIGKANYNYVYEVIPGEVSERCSSTEVVTKPTPKPTKAPPKPPACRSRPCQNGGDCIDFPPGSYQCDCPDDFGGRNCQIPLGR